MEMRLHISIMAEVFGYFTKPFDLQSPFNHASQNASRNCFFSGAVLSWGKKGTATCLRRLGDTWGKRQKVKKVQNAKAKKTQEN